VARRELELRITVPYDDDSKYLSDVYLEAMKAQVEYMEEHGKDIPGTGRHVVDEAVIWWCSRSVP
jgi:hypothetical protein